MLYSKSPLYLKVFTHIVQEEKEGHPPLCLPEPSTREGSLETSVHQYPAVQASLVTVQGRNAPVLLGGTSRVLLAALREKMEAI